MTSTARFWAVVPAAGSGKRFGADRPKQYLQFAGQTILEHTLIRLRHHPRLAGVVLVIAPNDPWWPKVKRFDGKIPLLVTHGGAERCHSVLNGIDKLTDVARAEDWVLVHDAARPLVTAGDINKLIDVVAHEAAGGLLAAKLSDTIKQANETEHSVATVDRSRLWRALTPQMFPLALLRRALSEAIAQQVLVTDEASAVERLGLKPRLVEGRADNIKITHASDLALAEFLWRRQQEE